MSDGKIPQTEAELKAALGDNTPVVPEEVSLEIEVDGKKEVFKGKNYEEVAKSLADAKKAATEAIRTRERENRELREQVQSLTPKPKPNEEEEAGFDKDTYYSLLGEDPLAAQDYMDSYRLGVPPEQVQAALRYTRNAAETFTAMHQNTLFRAKYPEAPQSDEFADLMIERMNEAKRAWVVDNLGSTYLELVHEGKVKADKGEPPKEEPVKAPPNLGGGGGVITEDEITKFQVMSTKDQEAYLRNKGYLR